jgi:hypothetical protein
MPGKGASGVQTLYISGGMQNDREQAIAILQAVD